jgi:ribose transport system permease protein
VASLATDLKYRLPGRYLASWGALATLLIAMAVAVPVALQGRGVEVATALAGILAVVSLGQMLVVMIGAIDLSVPAIVTASAGFVVHYGTEGSNVSAVVLGALAVSVAVSLANWVFISVLRLNAIVVTLATFGITTGGIVLWTGVSFSLTGVAPASLVSLTRRSVMNVNACFLVAVLVAVIVSLLLSKTRGGRQIAAIGSNRRAATFQGIRVERIEFITFAGVGLLYGLAGVMVAGFVVTPDTSIGAPYQLATITAVAIAGAAFTGGPASVSGVVVACLFLQLLDQALSIHGFAAGPRVLAQGLALVLAVSAITLGQFAVSAARARRRTSHLVADGSDADSRGSLYTPIHMKEKHQ